MCCVKWCRNDSLLETTCLQENLGKSVIYIFIENLLLILGTVQIKFAGFFFFNFLLAPLSHDFTWGLSFNMHLLYQESVFLWRSLGPAG